MQGSFNVWTDHKKGHNKVEQHACLERLHCTDRPWFPLLITSVLDTWSCLLSNLLLGCITIALVSGEGPGQVQAHAEASVPV